LYGHTDNNDTFENNFKKLQQENLLKKDIVLNTIIDY